jgi:uncharacterized DUF497 family protein
VFSWDAAKARSNLKKHGVSFEEAESVFDDPWVLDWLDKEHSEEELRRKCMGLSAAGRILVVAYAPRRSKDGSEIIRIISARRASRQEREAYP